MGDEKIFIHGSTWVRADFHLHTKADKEFTYEGEENDFVASYVDRLKAAGIELGVVTNHNKFNVQEFKALRRSATREGIGLLPGVELSVNDGRNGIHTLIVFADEWISNGEDHINAFLSAAFVGKAPAQYENENGRTDDGIVGTLKKLAAYNRDFFVVFAHVEANSGLWNELDGGRLEELAQDPLVKKYCLGFQKVRTHDRPDAKCRTKVQKWWTRYPAEVEGSDPKSLDQIGKGQKCYLKLGDFNFDALKFALTDFTFRLSKTLPPVRHSHINAVRFEGGLLDQVRVPLSPHMNCLIGIQGSGKSSVLECIRYALGIDFGENVQDKNYKMALVPHVLKSGGKVIIEATDRHGKSFEIHRITNHSPDVYVDGAIRPGLTIRETIVRKPLYFGQKDLSAAGKAFGIDLVEKLVGDTLKEVRTDISTLSEGLRRACDALHAVQTDSDMLESKKAELADIDFQLEQFEAQGVKEKLERQITFAQEVAFCAGISLKAEAWHNSLGLTLDEAREAFAGVHLSEDQQNNAFFQRYAAALLSFRGTLVKATELLSEVRRGSETLQQLHREIADTGVGLKEEFAHTERELVQTLADKGVTSIQPDAYVTLVERRAKTNDDIGDLAKRTAKEKSRYELLLSAISALNQKWLDEYKQVNGVLTKINVAQDSLKITPSFKGDKQAFVTKLEQVFRGSSIRKDTFQSLANVYADFSEIYRDLEEASKLAKSKSDAFKEGVVANLAELLTFQIPSSFEVTYRGKLLKSHSLGQRASAMMLFLLSQDDHDLLIIDQPEDDLDSQTVYEDVVKLVRTLKSDRQFIFATHNANFPVLGDAELVSAFSATDESISASSASIDSKGCQTKIVNIMEGGDEAFVRRKTIYEIWQGQ